MKHFSIAIAYSLVAFTMIAINAEAASAITFDSPRGGEVFLAGQVQEIRLGAKARAKSITIELSRDGGLTFEALGAIDNGVKDRSGRNRLAFPIAGAASSNCIVRATATIGKFQAVALSAPFVGSLCYWGYRTAAARHHQRQ
jgi:hypothetical protein